MTSMFGLVPQYSKAIPFAVLVCGLVWMQAVPFGFAQDKGQTTITSQTMTVLQGESRQTIFEGRVVLKKEDFVIHSDHMIVTFKKDAQNGSRQTEGRNKVDRIEASGNVVIEKANGKATCGRAVYYKDEEKVILTESPVAWQGGTRIEGTQMTMFLKEDRSIVEGGSRVVIVEE